MSDARDRRKLDAAARALRRVADLLADVDVDVGEARDSLGETIHAVDVALEDVGGEV